MLKGTRRSRRRSSTAARAAESTRTCSTKRHRARLGQGSDRQIEAAIADGDHYDAKVKVIGEYITHHVVEEHTEMFPKCRRAGSIW